ERIGHGDSSMLDHPLSRTQVPPDVGVCHWQCCFETRQQIKEREQDDTSERFFMTREQISRLGDCVCRTNLGCRGRRCDRKGFFGFHTATSHSVLSAYDKHGHSPRQGKTLLEL